MKTADTETKEENQRRIARQPILLKAILDTGSYEFECLAYDLSLKGVKLKLNLPLEIQCEVSVRVRANPPIPARVIWVRDGFIGLEFTYSPAQVAEKLGSLGARLPKV